MAGTSRTVRVRFDGSAAGLGRAAKEAEGRLERVRSKINDVSTFVAKAAVGVGAATAAGATAGAFALAALPLAFIGIGVAAAAQSEKVKTAFSGLKDHVVKTTQELAKPFEPVLVGIAAKAKTAFDSIKPQLASIFQALAPQLDSLATGVMSFVTGAMPGFQAAISAAKPVIDALSAGIASMGPALGTMFSNLAAQAPAFGAAMTTLFSVISAALPMVGSFLAFLAQWAGVIIPIAAGVAAVAVVVRIVSAATQAWGAIMLVVRAATVAWTAVQWLLNAAMAANPIGIVIVVVMALVAAIVIAYQRSATFRAIVQAAFNAVKAAITACVNGARAALQWFAGLGGLMRGWWNAAVQAVVGAVSALLARARAIPGQILSALGNLGSILVGAGRSLIEGLWNGIQAAFGWVKGKISGALQAIRNLFPFSPAKEGPFSGKGYTSWSGRALAMDFAKGITSGQSRIRSAAHMAASAAAGAMTPGAGRSWVAGAGALSGGAQFAAAGGLNVGGTVVQVLIDGQEFRGMIDTRISESNRDTRRGVRSGAYRGV